MVMQLLIKNGVYVNSDGIFEGEIAVNDGQITQIGKKLDIEAANIIDAKGKFILPGVIDTHVHLPWPSSNFDSVDDFHSGTLAAAHGGVTTIIEYIVPDESGRIIPALDNEIEKAKGRSLVDYSFHLIIRKVLKATLEDMAETVRRGFSSFKIYTAYSGFQLSDEEILTALKTAGDLKALVCFHAEGGILVNFAIRQLAEAGMTNISYYSQAHPRAADIEATQRVITYAKHLNARIHIVHINTREGAALVGEARRAGLLVSGETCPHYLMFTDEVYKTGKPDASYYILSPAIRGQDDQNYLWRAIESGELSTIATDHCPYNTSQKLIGGNDFRSIPGGAGGIETSLPVLYTYGVHTKKISLSQMVSLMSSNPAKLFNLYPKKGVIAVGSDADMVIYNPEGKSVIDIKNLHSNTDHTLYQDVEVIGKVEMTILRGNVLIKDGALVNEHPSGELLLRAPYSD